MARRRDNLFYFLFWSWSRFGGKAFELFERNAIFVVGFVAMDRGGGSVESNDFSKEFFSFTKGNGVVFLELGPEVIDFVQHEVRSFFSLE